MKIVPTVLVPQCQSNGLVPKWHGEAGRGQTPGPSLLQRDSGAQVSADSADFPNSRPAPCILLGADRKWLSHQILAWELGVWLQHSSQASKGLCREGQGTERAGHAPLSQLYCLGAWSSPWPSCSKPAAASLRAGGVQGPPTHMRDGSGSHFLQYC